MSPPKTINKSKISTVFNKDFTPTKLKKIPKKFSVYIPSNLPNNEKPRTVYDRRGLYKYLTQQCPRRREDPPPRSPMTRKPVNSVMWYNNLYTNEEIKASKNKKSDKYKLIEHMKTRKHLSAKQKMEYLNELKSKKKLNNLTNKINKFTIPKQNIPTNTENNAIKLESAAVLMNCVNTNASLFKPKRGESEHINTLNGDREWAKLFKKLRTLYLEKLTELIKLNKKGAAMGSILYRIPLLEKTVLAAEYMENPLFSDFAKEMPKNVKFKIDKNKLYDYIKKNIFTKDGRARSVGHVIEGAALYEGRVEGKAGLASSFASVITLSTGGSTGREGPVVLLGSLISSKVSRWINADGITGRNLMGCAVAAAVSASFNAPLAGALFALEVVLRHYAIQALAQILIASVAGTVISRLYFGNVTEFTLPVHTQDFYIELPAH